MSDFAGFVVKVRSNQNNQTLLSILNSKEIFNDLVKELYEADETEREEWVREFIDDNDYELSTIINKDEELNLVFLRGSAGHLEIIKILEHDEPVVIKTDDFKLTLYRHCFDMPG